MITELINVGNGGLQQGGAAPSLMTGDINGDGLADLIYFGNGSINPPLALGISSGASGASFAASTPSGASGLGCYVGNFEGSGRPAVACVSSGSISYSASNGTAFTNAITEPTANGAIGVTIANAEIANPCFVMDVNGDGRDDVVCPSPLSTNSNGSFASATVWGVFLATGSLTGKTAFAYQKWQGPTGGYTISRTCLVGDFNGDGLKDLACQYDSTSGTWNILLSTGAGWSAQTWTNGPYSGVIPPSLYPYYPEYCGGAKATQFCVNPCFAGDFDGDVISDIACPSASTTWQIGFGGGISAFRSLSSWTGTNIWTGPGSFASNYGIPFCQALDVFGTGLSGLLCVSSEASAKGVQWIYQASTGTSFTTTAFSTTWPSYNPSANSSAPSWIGTNCVFGDFNGDGILDVACHPSPPIAQIAPNKNQFTTWYMALSSRPQ